MAAVFSRLPMRVRCATQRDHVFHPEMNYSQTQLASLIGSPSGGWPTISRRARTSKKDKELVTLEMGLWPAIAAIADWMLNPETCGSQPFSDCMTPNPVGCSRAPRHWP